MRERLGSQRLPAEDDLVANTAEGFVVGLPGRSPISREDMVRGPSPGTGRKRPGDRFVHQLAGLEASVVAALGTLLLHRGRMILLTAPSWIC